MKIAHKHTGNAWTPAENALLVADYLENRDTVASGQPVNKAATIRALSPHLNNRSKGSIEAKRMNLSALLMDLGEPTWPGYAPLANYQRGLVDGLAECWGVDAGEIMRRLALAKGKASK